MTPDSGYKLIYAQYVPDPYVLGGIWERSQFGTYQREIQSRPARITYCGTWYCIIGYACTLQIEFELLADGIYLYSLYQTIAIGTLSCIHKVVELTPGSVWQQVVVFSTGLWSFAGFHQRRCITIQGVNSASLAHSYTPCLLNLHPIYLTPRRCIQAVDDHYPLRMRTQSTCTSWLIM